MQVFYKGIIILVVLIFWFYPGYLFLKMIWKSQIDPKATCSRIVTFLAPLSEMIATRNPKKIYQDGKEVGNITGKVVSANDRIIFEEVCDTGELNIGEPFEYERYKLKVTHIDEVIGIKMGMPTKKDVKRGMKCMVLK